MTKKTDSRYKLITIWTLVVLTGAVIIGVIVARKSIFEPFELPQTAYIYVDEHKNFEEIVSQLKALNLPSEKIFRFLSDKMHYKERIKTGRYAIKDGMTMPEVVRVLRSGNQTPVNLTFNNMRTKENLACRLSQQLMMDSITLLNALDDSTKAIELGFDMNNFVAMFIPNTYEVYWDTNTDDLLKRMKREYDRFWNDDRKKRAGQIGLSPLQVSVLASIVEEEASFTDEYPIVAGLYLNRLKKGMRLEADPTVKYALGDFGLRRILFKHLEVDSPYNTYRNNGLPPGPIRVPSVAAIDGVLSPQQHNYLFMCAKDDLSGRHNFAITHAEHSRNATRYQQALNRRGIY